MLNNLPFDLVIKFATYPAVMVLWVSQISSSQNALIDVKISPYWWSFFAQKIAV